MAELSSRDLWKLADQLSVINASILIAGGDPSEHCFNNEGERVQLTWQHTGFEAVFSALKSSIKTNKLRANLSHNLRGVQYYKNDPEYYGAVELGQDEEKVTYDMLVARNLGESGGYSNQKVGGATKLNFSVEDIRGETYLYIWKEPNWDQSTVEVIDIKKWLLNKGVNSDFFFPFGNKASVKNPENPRYAAKLACALAAWENVVNKAPGKSVKQTLQGWVQSNGVQYGLGEGGVVSPTAALEVAKIANWDTKGGANPTIGEAKSNIEAEEIIPENYNYGYPNYTDDDSEIPF